MRSLLISMAAAAALVVVSVDGYAADYELKGITTSSFDGNEDIVGFNVACQSDFGSDVRMCTSLEIVETANTSLFPVSSPAWVRPTYVANGRAAAASSEADATGVAGTGAGISCSGWRSNSNAGRGLLFTGNGLSLGTCDSAFAVACCGPVPAPAMAAVPSMLWFGRGLLAATILSAAAGVLFFRGRPVLGSGERGIRRRG